MAQMPQIKSNEVWEVEMTAAINEVKGGEEATTDDPCARIAWRRFTLMRISRRRRPERDHGWSERSNASVGEAALKNRSNSTIS